MGLSPLPQVTVVLNQVPRLVVLVLEAALPRSEVGGTGYVAAIVPWVWPLDEHISP